ncbi:MAG: response regulator [Chloroflexi bacterium]|jgi:CheY-like chemotaxis protein|nr:response regulator [Chloroflexota bacterium]
MKKILVVDDSSDIRLLLSRTLKAAGYTVSEATDGDEVLAATLSYEPDMILLDVAMARVDGFKALAHLKQDPRTKRIPVIMVTAKGHPSDLETARSLGALDYINKPWAHGEVELRVQWAITSVMRKREQDAQLKIDRLAG